MSDNPPYSQEEDQLAAVPDGDTGVANLETSTGPNTKDQEETEVEKRETIEEEQPETEGGGGESDGDENKGVKRKRDKMQDEAGQSTEKKRVKQLLADCAFSNIDVLLGPCLECFLHFGGVHCSAGVGTVIRKCHYHDSMTSFRHVKEQPHECRDPRFI